MTTETLYPASFAGVENMPGLMTRAREIDPDPAYRSKHLACLGPESAVDDNNLRAAWAALALEPYVKRTFGDSEDEFETLISDLMADLMHLCNAVGVDPADTMDHAYRRYTEEVRGEI